MNLRFEDNGKGIAPENLPKILTRFFTTARHRGGTGLGLNIVFNIVTRALGGEIRVESELGKGQDFFINLPKFAPLEKPKDDSGTTAIIEDENLGFRSQKMRSLLFVWEIRADIPQLLQKSH